MGVVVTKAKMPMALDSVNFFKPKIPVVIQTHFVIYTYFSFSFQLFLL